MLPTKSICDYPVVVVLYGKTGTRELEASSTSIRGKQTKTKSTSSDETLFEGDSDLSGQVDEGNQKQKEQIAATLSNDEGLDSFVVTSDNSSCDSVGCTMVGDYLCFPATLEDSNEDETTFVVQFSASVFGSTSTFSVDIPIIRSSNTEKDTKLCDQPMTRCYDNWE